MASKNKRKEMSGHEKRKKKKLQDLNQTIMNHGQTTLTIFF